MYDPKRWLLFSFVSSWVRGGNALFKLSAAVLLFLLFSWVVALYVAVKLCFAAARTLFVRNERFVRDENEPFVRRRTLRRIGGRGVDFSLVGVPLLLLAELSSSVRFTVGTLFVASIILFATSLALTASTPGKALFGIEIGSETGGSPSAVQSFVRESVAVVSIYVLPIAAYVVVKNGDGEQIGDVVARTRAIDAGSKGTEGVAAYVGRVRETLPAGSVSVPTSKPSSDAETALQRDGSETRLQTTADAGSGPETGSDGDGGSTGGTSTRLETRSMEERGRTAETTKAMGSEDGASTVDPETTCPSCGADVPSVGSYCVDCGAKL